MKRTGRYIFNALTVLSLLLCITTCVIWVRSYWQIDDMNFRSENCRSIYFLRVSCGQIEETTAVGYFSRAGFQRFSYKVGRQTHPRFTPMPNHFLGVCWHHIRNAGRLVSSLNMVLIPLRYFAFIFGALPTTRFVLWLLYRRRAQIGFEVLTLDNRSIPTCNRGRSR